MTLRRQCMALHGQRVALHLQRNGSARRCVGSAWRCTGSTRRCIGSEKQLELTSCCGVAQQPNGNPAQRRQAPHGQPGRERAGQSRAVSRAYAAAEVTGELDSNRAGSRAVESDPHGHLEREQNGRSCATLQEHAAAFFSEGQGHPSGSNGPKREEHYGEPTAVQRYIEPDATRNRSRRRQGHSP